MSCSAPTLLATAIANGYDKLSERELMEALVASACAGDGQQPAIPDSNGQQADDTRAINAVLAMLRTTGKIAT